MTSKDTNNPLTVTVVNCKNSPHSSPALCPYSWPCSFVLPHTLITSLQSRTSRAILVASKPQAYEGVQTDSAITCPHFRHVTPESSLRHVAEEHGCLLLNIVVALLKQLPSLNSHPLSSTPKALASMPYTALLKNSMC